MQCDAETPLFAQADPVMHKKSVSLNTEFCEVHLILTVREFSSGTTSSAQKYILNYLGRPERCFVTKSFLSGLRPVTFCSN